MRKLYIFFIVSIVSFLVGLGALFLGFFANWDLKFNDFFYQTINRTSNEIVIVAVDDKTLNEMGRWQDINRTDMGKVFEAIIGDGAAVLGVDINYADDSVEEHDIYLTNVIKKNKNIVLVNEFVEGENRYVMPIKDIEENASIGFANVELDSDGIVRSIRLFRDTDDKRTYSFSVEVLRKYFGLRSNDIKKVNNNLVVSDRPLRPVSNSALKYPSLSLPLNDNNFLINFFGKPYSFESIPFYKVLRGEFSKDFFKNKIVLLGATTYTLHDEYLTPVSLNGIGMPGVEIHANVLQTMLSQSFLKREAMWMQMAVLLILAFIVSFLWVMVKIRYAVIFTIVITCVYVPVSWGSFAYGLILSLAYPLFIIFISLLLALIARYFFEAREKIFLKKTFSRYVSASVVDKIMDKPEMVRLGGEKRNLTVMFSDLGNFTSFSEKLSPEKLVEFMNNYLSEMSDIILGNDGTLDKYEGDAIMAFWGAPIDIVNDAEKACTAAYLNLKAFKELEKDWIHKYAKNISLRIGLHKGEMIVGNLGSEKRFDYTVMGDNVNLSSRLEGVNKVYGTSICVSGAVYMEVKNKFIFRELDIIRVKGKKKPVKIYELVGMKDENIDEEFIMLFHDALNYYRNKEWSKAKSMFNRVIKLKKNDPPSKVFLERIELFIKTPPDNDWEGIYDMSSK